MAELAAANYDGPDPKELKEKRRRLGRAYADGAFTDEQYQRRLAEIDHHLDQACTVTPPTIEAAVELFTNIPMLWAEATPDERRQLVNPLVELVYVDLKTKLIAAFKPAPRSGCCLVQG